jgi:hypothetical protein
MRFCCAVARTFICTVVCSAALILFTAFPYAQDIPNPAKMPVPKSAAPKPAPTPQGPKGEPPMLKYRGEPLSADEIGKPTHAAPIVAPGKL